MSDFSKHRLGRGASVLQSETERSLSRLRDSIGSLDVDAIAFTPEAGQFADPQPTTLGDALRRVISSAIASGGVANPIP